MTESLDSDEFLNVLVGEQYLTPLHITVLQPLLMEKALTRAKAQKYCKYEKFINFILL